MKKKYRIYRNGGEMNQPQNQIPMMNPNEGKLTEYNGNTHEEGGIQIGNNSEVEDKETRWEDYIFSNTIKVPGTKKTFAEYSKFIKNKYPRENDPYDKKALDKEMNALMSLHEEERERFTKNLSAKYTEEMNKNFGYGGKMKYTHGGPVEDHVNIDEENYMTEQDYNDAQLQALNDNQNFNSDDYWNSRYPPQEPETIHTAYNPNYKDLRFFGATTPATTPAATPATQGTGQNLNLQGFNKIRNKFITGLNQSYQSFLDSKEDFHKSIGNTSTGARQGQLPDESNYTSGTGSNQPGKTNWQDAGVFAAQNIGNIYNIGRGLQTSKEIDLGRVDPDLANYDASRASTRRAFDSAGNVGREQFRGSSQRLPNLIALNTILADKESQALAGITEREENKNKNIQNAAQLQNLRLLQQEELANAQTDAVRDQYLAQGLVGMGENIASLSREGKQRDAQGRAIEHMDTEGYGYVEDGKGGYIRVNLKTGNPVQQQNIV